MSKRVLKARALDRFSTKLIATQRVIPSRTTSPEDGKIKAVPLKIIWVFGHGIAGLAGLIIFPQLDALLVFLGLTGLTICAGHSVGMHRLLIHRSFETPRSLEYLLVWLGSLVGMAGPFGMIHAHDMRDWHQRQWVCPPHPSHDAPFLRDAWWQMCCIFQLRHPPKFTVEEDVKDDPVYRFMERTWMAQQLPIAIFLYALGGWAWVLWGVSLRIFVSLFGHWMVGHFAHGKRDPDRDFEELPVQGYNLPGLGLLTFGENWHGNHHAFPRSAKLGVDPGQVDPGYYLIMVLQKFGLAWNVNTPETLYED